MRKADVFISGPIGVVIKLISSRDSNVVYVGMFRLAQVRPEGQDGYAFNCMPTRPPRTGITRASLRENAYNVIHVLASWQRQMTPCLTIHASQVMRFGSMVSSVPLCPYHCPS